MVSSISTHTGKEMSTQPAMDDQFHKDAPNGITTQTIVSSLHTVQSRPNYKQR